MFFIVLLLSFYFNLVLGCTFSAGYQNNNDNNYKNLTDNFYNDERSNETTFYGSSSAGSDKYGKWMYWSDLSKRCFDSDKVLAMYRPESPYDWWGQHHGHPSHYSLLFDVYCSDGHHYWFTTDFTESSGLRQRWGYFSNIKRYGGSWDIRYKKLTLGRIKQITSTSRTYRDYQLCCCNCHGYAIQKANEVITALNG